MTSRSRTAFHVLLLVMGITSLLFAPGCVFNGENDVDTAWSALKKGDSHQAIRFASRAINFGGLSGEKLGSAYECRAAANRNRYEFDRALADLDKLVALRPEYAGGYLARGEVLFQAKVPDRALADMDQGLRLADPSGNAKGASLARRYFIRGNIRLVKKDADGAMADYEHALSIDPTSLDARMGRSYVLQARGQKREALAEMELVCQAASKNFSIPLSRQSVYLRRVITLRMENGFDPSKPAPVIPAEAPPAPTVPKSEPAESPEAPATPDTDIEPDAVSEQNLDKPLLGN
ncbi:hypothetical protein KBA41_02960 [Candidatus Ozemobacteraceae bacterium]|nr:hypothetical protein [Candidatus Ozemobacteraceae bacterium]